MNTVSRYVSLVSLAIILILGADASVTSKSLKATSIPTVGGKITPTSTLAVVTPTSGKITSTPAVSTNTPTNTPVVPPTPTNTVVASPTNTNTPTSVPPTATPSGPITPYLGAPTCPDVGAAHDTSKFHTLWDSVRGCHYLNEHGQNPFTVAVANAFPGFDLHTLLGGVEIGHTNPSSPMENTMKHGGFKWQVDTSAPQGCALGFEDGTVAVDAYAIQYHGFGDSSVEFETRNHSAAALLRQCQSSNPGDKGYVYVVQLEEYGQRVSPYQGAVLPYPNNPQPPYDSARGPYFTTDCVGTGLPGCRQSLDQIRTFNGGLNTNSIWTSKPLSSNPQTPRLFRLLFRIRDTYQVLDSTDLSYPFTFRYICGDMVYNAAGCRYNNSTGTIDEVAGNIPASWDGLAGFDTDSRVGRITAEGFVTAFGLLNTSCSAPGTDCYPIKMVGAFTGFYSSEVSAVKVSNPTPQDTPERDIYFCPGGVVCNETDPGAMPSGWIGPEN